MLSPATKTSRALGLFYEMKRPERGRTCTTVGLLLLQHSRKLSLVLPSKRFCEILNVLQALRVLLILIVDAAACHPTPLPQLVLVILHVLLASLLVLERYDLVLLFVLSELTSPFALFFFSTLVVAHLDLLIQGHGPDHICLRLLQNYGLLLPIERLQRTAYIDLGQDRFVQTIAQLYIANAILPHFMIDLHL